MSDAITKLMYFVTLSKELLIFHGKPQQYDNYVC